MITHPNMLAAVPKQPIQASSLSFRGLFLWLIRIISNQRPLPTQPSTKCNQFRRYAVYTF